MRKQNVSKCSRGGTGESWAVYEQLHCFNVRYLPHVFTWSVSRRLIRVYFRPAPLVRSEEGAKAQKKVWDELSAKLEKIQPGIMQNV